MHATDVETAYNQIKQFTPELVVADVHLLNNGHKVSDDLLKQELITTKTIFTSAYPDPQQEAHAKQAYSAQIFLRQPFSRAGIEQALRSLEGTHPVQEATNFKAALPKVRVPVRLKITFPYVVLALLLALAAAYVVSQVVLDTIEERFTNQLIETGKLTNDWMVQEEDRLLETLRLLANTQGMADAIIASDAERLRLMALPIAVNSLEEAIDILDTQGTSILSMHHVPGGNIEEYDTYRGETIFSTWNFVNKVLAQQVDQGRDKFAGLARAPWGDYLYIAGPVTDDNGDLVGMVMVGKSLPTLVRQIRQDTLAHTTLYDFDGQPLVSTLSLFNENVVPLEPQFASNALDHQDESSLTRPLDSGSIAYTEIVGPWEVREFTTAATRNNHDLGLIGVALAETFLARPSQITRTQIFVLTAITFVLVIALGIVLANRITSPLLRVVEASAKVAQGDLDVQIEAKGDDEVAVLAHSFNQMVSGLKEGYIYRDLFGRTVSVEVREQLRQGFASGDLRMEGQEAIATILVSTISGLTTLSETESPETILNWLNEYYEEIIAIVTAHGGVVGQLESDALMAYFGILPRPVSAQESAYRACQTALTMLDAIEHFNTRRQSRGDPPFAVGIGINTGPVTAGGLGGSDRIQYTVIGDTVNATERLESLTRQFGAESIAVLSQHTLFALREERHDFELEPLGAHKVKGKVEQLLVYRLQPTAPVNSNQ